MARDVLRAGGLLRVRTGRLWGSIGSRVIDDGRNLLGLVGSGVRQGTARVKYANIHITGGTIKAKPGKFLTIPTRHALTASGSQLKGGAMSARDFKNTFIRKSKTGTLIIFQKNRNGIIPLFILKRSVRIPKRDYIGATSQRVQREMPGIFQASVERMAKV